MIRLADPWFLLLLILPLAAGWLLWRRRRAMRPHMRFSSLALLAAARRTLRTRLLGLPAVLMLASAILMVGALARPQSAWREDKRFTEGIDIMLVIDVSDSMKALDFQPNRLSKAKQVVAEFIDGRSNDQIGVVIFGRDSFALCPLTHDYAALRDFVDKINFDLVNGDSTAIGMGLAGAVDRLRRSQAKSKVAILLTDGENNAGQIDPLTAARVARDLGVRVYTIGIGSASGRVPIPNPGNIGPPITYIPSQLNTEELTQMAEMTGGQFFHATDGDSLEKIYRQIDKMERTEIEINEMHYFDELGHYLIVPALLLVLAALLLENSWLRTFP
jgi:Ca-activated chloride channel family protein